MMQTATVIKCKGELALVKTLTKSTPCNACKNPCAQKSCSALKPVTLWAKNSVCAKVGDETLVEQAKTSTGVFSALCCMALPLITAVAAFMLARGRIEEVFAFLVSLAAFAVTELIAIPAAKSYERRHPTLNIVKNLENR